MSNKTSNPLAVQLYTLRRQIAENYAGTLRAVAELGYRAVETYTLGDYTAKELRAVLDEQGLQVAGMHIALDRLEGDLEAAIADARTLEAGYIVCPFLAPQRRGDAEGYRKLAHSLNEIAARCKASGFPFAYHNHDFEFAPQGETNGYDILRNETDANLVKFELDVYWAARAGHDPVALIRSLGDRAALVHLKDMTADGSQRFAEVGSGTLDIPGILAACDEVGTRWLIVEQDECDRPPLESIGMSLSYLRSLGRA